MNFIDILIVSIILSYLPNMLLILIPPSSIFYNITLEYIKELNSKDYQKLDCAYIVNSLKFQHH